MDKRADYPLVSFVVLSWNTLRDTKLCIESIRKTEYPNKEIVVIDNGSTDGSKEYLEKLEKITYVSLPKNMGFTGGQIIALRHCNGEYIALINSDAVIAKDWAKRCLETFNSEGMVGAVGGKAYTWTKKSEAFDTSLPFYSYQVVDLNLAYASTMQTGEERLEVDSISGAAVMISRKAIEKVGYFDNAFFAYFEETDLFARFKRAGFKIIYEPTVHAWHQIAKSTKSKPYFYLYQMHRNRFMFGFKNFDMPAAFAWRYLKDGIKALSRYLRHKNLEDKARILALAWNALHLPSIVLRRYAVQRLGGSYDNLVKERCFGRDVTVVIPNYNYAAYLPDAIKSVLSQTVKPNRVLVIDDGSSDDSVSVAKSFEEVEVISKHNEGVVITKNLGISLCHTTWTLFVDSDDVLPKNYIEVTLDTAQREHSDVVYTDSEYFGEEVGRQNAGKFSMARILQGNFIHNSALINTDALKSIGGYKVQMSKGYEDWELYITLGENNKKFSYEKKTTLKYRQHGVVLSRNRSAIATANELLSLVHTIHADTYIRFRREDNTLRKVFRQLERNPSILAVGFIAIPYATIGSLWDLPRLFVKNYTNSIRTYIHWKDGR